MSILLVDDQSERRARIELLLDFIDYELYGSVSCDDWQQVCQEMKEMGRLQVLVTGIEFNGKRKDLGMQKVFLGGFVHIEEADILLVIIRNGILNKNQQKRMLIFIFRPGNARPGFQLPLLNKGIRRIVGQKIPVRIHQRVLKQKLIQIIP